LQFYQWYLFVIYDSRQLERLKLHEEIIHQSVKGCLLFYAGCHFYVFWHNTISTLYSLQHYSMSGRRVPL